MKRLLLTTALLSLSLPVMAQDSHPDISFIPIGKAVNLRQMNDGETKVLNYHFYAELFIKEGGSVTDAKFTGNGKTVDFDLIDNMLKVKGDRYKTREEMDVKYPDGEYHYNFKTSDGKNHDLKFMVGGENGDRTIPDFIKVTFKQGGIPVSQDNINPDKDLTITWSPFSSGRADPNGIIDDMIFVSVTDCHGNRVDHSGTAFTDRGAMTFRETQYRLHADQLKAGMIYPIFVEHVKADTLDQDGINGMVANATTVFVDVKTTGENMGDACPALLPQMEPGQTDRPGKYQG
ncbi:hypothetical protein [Pseudemcibacter aquimaris]|uniref:hypothetical protein n=1 Tax=Pseudemcibacter aquimaris TaxID=2857064 RepID=UPI0020120684|nr:hypothetical protein [Pseudemcibacter aquimaris]MCC3862053.1 hypothetical protein [Pseudemcibacter aquimaris]WDU58805.1 hypothetical protein KW060_00770 [Pseudemcibacter aquimaris]